MKLKLLFILLTLISCGKKTEYIVKSYEVNSTTLAEITTICNEIYTRSNKIEQCIGKFVVSGTVK